MMLSDHSDEWLGIGQTYLAYLVKLLHPRPHAQGEPDPIASSF